MFGIFTSIIFSLSCMANSSIYEDTMFYSKPVNEIELKNIQIEENKSNNSVVFEKTSRKKAKLRLPKHYYDYYNKTTEQNKKIFVKLASLNIFEKVASKKKIGEPYSLLFKEDRSFNLETIAYIPVDYKKAQTVIKDFVKYQEWVLRDINVRRNGQKGKYFIDIKSMRFVQPIKKGPYFRTNVSMNNILKGSYWLNLMIEDKSDNEKDPTLTLRMDKPSKLAKEVVGTFYFIVLPNETNFIIYFSGRTQVNWTIYNFLPLMLVKSEVLERIYTLLENIEYRTSSLKKPSGSSTKLQSSR